MRREEGAGTGDMTQARFQWWAGVTMGDAGRREARERAREGVMRHTPDKNGRKRSERIFW
jgi:hypothetical protein